jgi:hypothetical protein
MFLSTLFIRWYIFVKSPGYQANDMLHIIPQSDRIFLRDISYPGFLTCPMLLYLSTIWGLYCDLLDYDLVNNPIQQTIIWRSVFDLFPVNVLLGLRVKLHLPISPLH